MEKVINIIQQFSRNNRIVPVVSALSSYRKEDGTTSRFLRCAALAMDKKNYDDIISSISDTHNEISSDLIRSSYLRNMVEEYISNELNEVTQYLKSISIIQELSPKSHDKIIGCGERLSAYLLTHILMDQNYIAKFIDLSHVFDGLNANDDDFQNKAQGTIRDILKPAINKFGCIPVCTGYIGDINGGIMSALSRGYSDFTAALCAGISYIFIYF